MTFRRSPLLAIASILFACGGAAKAPPGPLAPPLATTREEGLLTMPYAGEIPDPGRVPREDLPIETGPLAIRPSAPFRIELVGRERYPLGLPGAVLRYGWSLWGLRFGGFPETGAVGPTSIPLSTTFSLLLASGARTFPSTLTRETFVVEAYDPRRAAPPATGRVYFLVPPGDVPVAVEFRFGAFEARRDFLRPPTPDEAVPLGAGGHPGARLGAGWILARALRIDRADSPAVRIEFEFRGGADPRGHRLFLYDAGGRLVRADAPLGPGRTQEVVFPAAHAPDPPFEIGLEESSGDRILFSLESSAPPDPPAARSLPTILHEGLFAEIVSAEPGRLRISLVATTETPMILPTSNFSLRPSDGAPYAPRADAPFTLFPFHRVARDLRWDSAPAPGGGRILRLVLGGVEREVRIP